MNWRFTIGKKIGTGFGVLILFIMVVFGATFLAVNNGISTFQENDNISNELVQVITPSKEAVTKLRLQVKESRQLAIQWVNVQNRNDVPDKIRLVNLMKQNIPTTIEKIDVLSSEWDSQSNKDILTKGKVKITEKLFASYEEIMMYLPDFASYDDDIMLFSARFLVGQDGDVVLISEEIDQNLLNLQNNLEKEEADALALVKASSKEAKNKFQSLSIYWFLGAGLILFAILIAIFTTNSIVKPVRSLREIIVLLSRGIFPKKQIKVNNDEVGEMSTALIGLVDGLKSTTNFAKEVGQSNFNFPYQPLSDDDVLGHALLKMRDELAETERILEQKVKERTEEVVLQRDEIDRQRLKLEDLYNDVTDSIRYAKRLQYSILPPAEVINEVCPESFVLFKPKDIVSGDFYWFETLGGKSFAASVDCTGHGVPGAFMSLVGANGLNGAVREDETITPALVLDELNKYVSDSLNKGSEDNYVRDGMDISIIAVDYEKMKLEFAGANNPLYLIRDGEMQIIKADKFAIGSFDPGSKTYTNHSIDLKKGDVIYLFTDGYADQFGGNKGKKFMYKNFRNELLEVHKLNMEEQESYLENLMQDWQGAFEQVDDILVIGVRI